MKTMHLGRGCRVAALGIVLGALAAAGCANREALTGPDALMGVWMPDAAPAQLLTVDGKAPPLTEEAAEVHAERLQRFTAGDTSYDQTTWCAGPGMPRILTMPYPFEIRRDGDFLAFIHGWYRWHRVVDMSGNEADPPLPLTMGFPVGSWEGDTLVIRTRGLIDVTVLDASGLPHSEEMTMTERLRVLRDGRLENRITIEDPETFSEPWETVLYFHRDPGAKVTDDVCPDRIARGEPAVRKEVPPVTRAATKAPAAARAAEQAAPAPRFSGMWEPATFGFMVQGAPLTAAGKELVDRGAAAMASGSIMHTAWTSCRPGAVSTMTMPREKILVLQSDEEITILYEMPRMTRRIRMNAEHPAELEPSYVGDSVGRWEGDTLVVDSVGFNGYAELDARGQPTSPALHTVERFRLSEDGNRIEIEVTITDPEYYQEPFTIKRAWRRSEARHPFEYDCMENPREEDFENAYYVRDRYRPTCMRVEGEGMEPSRVVCRRRDEE
ncbi:MAG: hypothetical protein DIU62_003470 [Pseudomonadota bacterium]|jgi:hypothetical protein